MKVKMNIKILDSWLREYLKTAEKPRLIADLLTSCGPSVDHLQKVGDDFAYDVEITTNRIDCASVIGLAREATAILKNQGITAKLVKPKLNSKTNVLGNRSKLTISDPNQLTRKAMALVIDQVKVTCSPQFIKERLQIAGIRSLNNLIDITNYLMLEIGHPAHIFDYDRLNTDKLLFRYAKANELFIALDGRKFRLNKEDVVIDDGSGRIVDLPGVIGAENSMVTEDTRRAVYFVEMNQPSQIRRTSMKHAIRTLAASYNENNPDYASAETAFWRGIELLKRYAGAKIGSRLVSINRIKPQSKSVSLSVEDIYSYMGVELKEKTIITILADLGFKLLEKTKKGLIFQVPVWRLNDVSIKEDLIEEVARLWGYHKLASYLPPFVYQTDQEIRSQQQVNKIAQVAKERVSALGYFELYNYSMVSEELTQAFAFSQKPIRMTNPLSNELVCFRQSLLPSLVKAAQLNNNKKCSLRLFELGKAYLPQPKNLPHEKLLLSFLTTDSYFELKGLLESLFQFGNLNKDIVYHPYSNKPYLEKKTCATIYLNNIYLGEIGQLHSEFNQKFDLNKPVMVAELDFELLAKHFQLMTPVSKQASKTPFIEDLTYRFNQKNHWQELAQSIKKKFRAVAKIELAARYQDFYTMRIYSYPTSKQSILDKIIEYLEKQFSLQIKKTKDDKNK